MNLETREFQLRAADPDEGTLEGIAVPWDTVAEIGGVYREKIARGAVEDGHIGLFWRHDEVIGKVIASEDRDEGFWIKAMVSDTALGRDALTLLRDGAVDRLSIGFEPVEHTETTEENGSLTVTRTKIRVREVSIVPVPAYEGATITNVRHKSEEDNMTVTTVTAEDLAEVRSGIDELTRRMDVGFTPITHEPKELTRSFGDLVKKIAAGDEIVTRAYEGAVSSDAVLQDAWLGSLVKVIQQRQIVANTFARGGVPASGLSVEYARLASDTTQVGVQAAEGDDLLFGKVALEVDSAAIKTLGGWSSLSRQAIERTNVGILDTTFTAMAEKYGRAVEVLARQALTAGIAAADEVTGDLTTQDNIVELLLELVEEMDDRGHNLDGLFVDKATFLALYGVAATDRVLQVSSAPADRLGSLSIASIEANLANIPVRVLPGAAAGTVVAYDASAIKTLSSNMLRLQDENIVNLTRDFSVYGYGASFVQVPDALLKVEA